MDPPRASWNPVRRRWKLSLRRPVNSERETGAAPISDLMCGKSAITTALARLTPVNRFCGWASRQ